MAAPPRPLVLLLLSLTPFCTRTGKQGVILSHRAVVSTVASLMTFIDTLTPGKGNFLDENDVFLSFLPLAHIFDR